MADPICRWRNAKPQTVCEIVNILPHEIMKKVDFRAEMESRWQGFFTTAYQLACQLGLYYESVDGMYYPRFYEDISLDEAKRYLEYWIHNYYVPNPYNNGFNNLEEPIYLIGSIVQYIEQNPTVNNFYAILNSVLKESIGNSDILINAINSFSKVLHINKQTGDFDLLDNYKITIDMYSRSDKKSFFENFSNYAKTKADVTSNDIQKAYKTFCIGKSLSKSTVSGYTSVLKRKSYINVINASLGSSLESIYALGLDVSQEILSSYNVIEGIVALNTKDKNLFSASIKSYIEFLNSDLCENLPDNIEVDIQKIYYGAPGTGKSHTIKEITKRTENKTTITFHPDTDYASFVGCYKPIVSADKTTITYGFSPQAFAKAYVEAWSNLEKPYYLIIEEINRGNCAQIFGDIFQLLDRDDNGFSKYVIDVDNDFKNYLDDSLIRTLANVDDYKRAITGLAEIPFDKFDFSKIALPNNLHILATMNTSDQSLFPMDSAFKRRWDWEYVPIQPNKVDKVVIKIGDNEYYWREFIIIVNEKIAKAHESEDKQLGPFFVKAKKEKNIDGKEIESISEERFVSKVMFYLWFEVFKDEVNNTIFFTKKKAKDSDDIQNKTFTFNNLFTAENEGESEINSELLNDFMWDSLEMKPLETDTAKPAEEATTKPVVAEQ